MEYYIFVVIVFYRNRHFMPSLHLRSEIERLAFDFGFPIPLMNYTIVVYPCCLIWNPPKTFILGSKNSFN